MSTNISVNRHDGMQHAIDSVFSDLEYILQQDDLNHWLSKEERYKIKETQLVLYDLEKR
jgi:hypothetical protein